MALRSAIFVLATLLVLKFSAVCAEVSSIPSNPLRESTPITSVTEIDKILEDTYKCNNYPAIGISIVSTNPNTSLGSTFTYSKSFGKLRMTADTPSTPETGFCIGSITKSMTSILLLKLLRLAGKNDARYNVTMLLKELDPSLDFEGSSLRDVTLEDLVSHQSGLPELFGPVNVAYPPTTTRKELAHIIARIPKIHPTREVVHYNNHVYSLAGYASELIAMKIKGHHVEWEDLMREYIFQPLGVTDQIHFTTSLDLNKIAAPYFTIEGKLVAGDKKMLEPVGLVGPAGSMCLSPNAMTAWLQMLLNDGRFAGQQVVESEDIQDAWEERGFFKEVGMGYGLGFMNGKYKDHKMIVHNGNLPPYISSMMIFPDLKIAVLSSTSVPDLLMAQKAAAYHILDRLLGLENQTAIPCQNTLNYTRPARAVSKVTLNPAEYVGRYANPIFGHLEIIEFNGELHLLIGELGNITIDCRTSETKCDAKFNGVLWFLSDADSSLSTEKLPTSTINFWKNRGELVHTISMSWYSPVYLLEFRRVLSIEPTSTENSVGVLSCLYMPIIIAVIGIICLL